MNRMKIIFLGTPEFAVPIMEALNEKYEISLVVTQPDKPGKRNKIQESPVKKRALELGLEVFQPTKIRNDYAKIVEKKADIMITAAYGQFIPDDLLNEFHYCLNVHGSLLPRHRGGAPIQRAIMEGDKTTGVTIMEMVHAMDAGRMFAKREIEILDSDDNTSLFNKLSLIGRDLLLESLPDILSAKNKGVFQNEEEATYSYNLTKEEELIDFNNNSRNIFNQVRGLSEEPGAYFSFNNESFKVYKTKIVEDNSDLLPGTIISLNKEFVIKTKDGAISILEIKPAGKNIMPIKNFLNGQRIFKEKERIL